MHEDGVWVGVSSSNVQAARRVGEDLEVMFRPQGGRPGGRGYRSRHPRAARTWRYPGAGRLLESLTSAPSAGKYVAHVLRPAFGDGYEV